MFHLQLNRKTLYRNESLCLTQVCISAAHREKMIQNNLQRKTVEKKRSYYWRERSHEIWAGQSMLGMITQSQRAPLFTVWVQRRSHGARSIFKQKRR